MIWSGLFCRAIELATDEVGSFSWLSSSKRIFLSESPNGPYGLQPSEWGQIGTETDNFRIGITGFWSDLTN
jgi:hypothetical protein